VRVGLTSNIEDAVRCIKYVLRGWTVSGGGRDWRGSRGHTDIGGGWLGLKWSRDGVGKTTTTTTSDTTIETCTSVLTCGQWSAELMVITQRIRVSVGLKMFHLHNLLVISLKANVQKRKVQFETLKTMRDTTIREMDAWNKQTRQQRKKQQQSVLSVRLLGSYRWNFTIVVMVTHVF
jgi:hypothetical protein